MKPANCRQRRSLSQRLQSGIAPRLQECIPTWHTLRRLAIVTQDAKDAEGHGAVVVVHRIHHVSESVTQEMAFSTCSSSLLQGRTLDDHFRRTPRGQRQTPPTQ